MITWASSRTITTRSGNARKAVDYLARAAAQAAQRSVHAQATAYLTSALEMLDDWPQGPERAKQELALLLMLARSRGLTAGYAATESEFARARELCQQVGETPQTLPGVGGPPQRLSGTGEISGRT